MWPKLDFSSFQVWLVCVVCANLCKCKQLSFLRPIIIILLTITIPIVMIVSIIIIIIVSNIIIIIIS